MEWALVLVLITRDAGTKAVHSVPGFNSLELCEAAGRKVQGEFNYTDSQRWLTTCVQTRM